jgi:hypothetical protein
MLLSIKHVVLINVTTLSRDVRGVIFNFTSSHILTHFANLQLMTVETEKKSKKIHQLDTIKLRKENHYDATAAILVSVIG